MSKLIGISDGHGANTAGKRTPTLPNGQKSETGKRYMNENLFNRAVVKYLDAELKRNGFKTILLAPTDADTPLSTRTNLANAKNVDLYVSVHANANTGKFGSWGGIETFTWHSGEGYRIGKLIHNELIKGSPLQNRGMKNGRHLWEIRKPDAPAVLVECGFMDSHKDYKYLLSDAYRKECAVEIAKGICKAYGVTYKAQKAPSKPSKANTNANTHKVVRGDTLWSIAKDNGISVSELKALNKGKDLTPLDIGAVLNLKTTKKKTVKSYTLPTGVYRKGDKGNAVKQIQQALNKLNFKVGDADGIFGAKTKDAITRFQKVHLPYDVDGVYGNQTRTKMLQLLK